MAEQSRGQEGGDWPKTFKVLRSPEGIVVPSQRPRRRHPARHLSGHHLSGHLPMISPKEKGSLLILCGGYLACIDRIVHGAGHAVPSRPQE